MIDFEVYKVVFCNMILSGIMGLIFILLSFTFFGIVVSEDVAFLYFIGVAIILNQLTILASIKSKGGYTKS